MKCQRFQQKKVYVLKLLFILFLSIISESISYGMEVKLDEEIEPCTVNLKKSLIKKEVDDPPERMIYSNFDEKFLRFKNSGVSSLYVLAFQESVKENSCCLALKYIASFIGGFGAGIPSVGATLKAGEYYGSTELGYYFSAATILSATGIISWATWELIEDSQHLVERSLQHKRSSISSSRICGKEVAKGVAKASVSLILGALSTVPDVYAAYKYNTVKELAILTFIYEMIPRTLGFYKLISLISSKIENSAPEEENKVKNRGLEIIDLTEAYFLKSTQENSIEEVRERLKSCNTAKEIYSFLSSHSQKGLMETEVVLPYYYANGVPRKVIQSLSLIFPISNAIVNTVLTYKGYNLITNDTVLLPLLTGISVLPTFLLNAYGTTKVSGGLFDKLYSYFSSSNVSSSDYFGTFYPKTKGTFVVSALLLVSSTAGAGVYIILDNLDDTVLDPVKYPLAALAIASSVTYGSYAVTTALINFGESISKHCNKVTSYVFNCLKKLDDVRNLIVQSSLEYVKSFISEINPDRTNPNYGLT